MKKIVFLLLLIVSFFIFVSCSSGITVTFKYEDGTIIETVKVKEGEKVIAPEVECEEGFEFDKWNVDLDNIKEDCDVTPLFKKIKLKVNFYIDDEIIETIDVEYGESVTPPTFNKEGLNFIKWDKELDNIKVDLDVKAVYEKLEYTVKFYDINNKLLSEKQVLHGETLEFLDVPVVDGYDFVKWDHDLTSIKSNLEVKPIYTKKIYKVKFYDLDNNLLTEKDVEYGDSCESVDAPVIEGYDFSKWDQDLTSIKSDLEVKPVYVKKMFKVRFYDINNELYLEKEVEYDSSCKDVVAPQVDGYEFIKWNCELVYIKENLEAKPIYEKIEYSISYYDGNTKLDLQPNKYDVETLVFTPEYEKAGYDFVGWFESENSTSKIASFGPGEIGNKVFYAKYEEIKEEEKIKLPEGAFYFIDIKKTPHSSNPNLIVFQPNLATAKGAPSTSVTKYDWNTSDASIATISQWSTITKVSNGIFILSATYKDDPSIVGYAICKVTPDNVVVITEEEANKEITYTVTFKDINGNVISTQTVKEGGDAVLPTPPVVEGKAFDGWDKLHYNIEADVTITATYRDGTNKYAGKTVSILGDSISTYKGIIPDGYATFYPYSTADISNYNETWWMQVINKLGMKLHANSSWGGSCVSSGTGASATVNDSRLSTLLVDGIAPDVIIIFMGNNDCASKYVQHSTFDSSFKTMMDKIKKLCSSSEIIVMTLPPAGSFFNESERVQYNNTIIKYANEYNCTLVQLTKEFEKCDSIHPKKKGMDVIYEQVYQTLIK